MKSDTQLCKYLTEQYLLSAEPAANTKEMHTVKVAIERQIPGPAWKAW